MEYKLNKIDTDIRKKIQEESKANKIHANDKINIKKDIKEEHKNNKYEENNYHENSKNRYITIDGLKLLAYTFEIKAEKLEYLNVENSNGRNIDIKK